MNYDDYTIVMSANMFPLLEMSIVLIKYFYQNIKIVLCFDNINSFSEKRELFLKQFNNITIIKNRFGNGHSKNIDYLINNHVQTKYSIIMDDDVIMYQKGLLNYFSFIIEKENDMFFLIGEMSEAAHFFGKQFSPRINPFCMLVKTNVFKTNKMSFSPLFFDKYLKKIKNSTLNTPLKATMYDVGGLLLIRSIDENLNIFDTCNNLNKFVFHIKGGSQFFSFNKKLLSVNEFDGKTISLIDQKQNFFTGLKEQISSSGYVVIRKNLKDIILNLNCFLYKTHNLKLLDNKKSYLEEIDFNRSKDFIEL